MSSALTQIQVPIAPELRDVLDLLKKEIFLTLNCHHVGTIQSFNETQQTAQVTLNYTKTFYQQGANAQSLTPTQVSYPILMDCPVVILSGGPAWLNLPVAAGDECLVLFNDRDMDNWFQGVVGAPVATSRLHSFSDAIALVGLRSLNRSIGSFDPTRAILTDGNAAIGINPSTHKLTAKNASYDLNTLLQNLCTQLENLASACAAITVTCAAAGSPSGPPINAATISAVSTQIQSIATEIGGLLE